MTFRALFIYTLMRGVLDAVLRRPEVHKRILMVLAARQVRLVAYALSPLHKSMSDQARSFVRIAKRYRRDIKSLGEGRTL